MLYIAALGIDYVTVFQKGFAVISLPIANGLSSSLHRKLKGPLPSALTQEKAKSNTSNGERFLMPSTEQARGFKTRS
jgi:hypothetical protein